MKRHINVELNSESSLRLPAKFFQQEALALAPQLLGKVLVRAFSDGKILRQKVTELEVYYGEEDLACHASKGRTLRTEVMYAPGGLVYVYLIYGMYWMLNIVTGPKEHPQAILIRGLEEVSGPGRVGKFLQLDKSFNGEDLSKSQRLWLEDAPTIPSSAITATPRIGIDYAQHCKEYLWRFLWLPDK
ncbi:MAG: 3-methyladenine glycosylase [Gammaproteobacteria bacterium]|jgi:DNA-3-methyladenine glycosylase|nr:3-methyladenine glycosylase [Gammaproteobacteria bacterium]